MLRETAKIKIELLDNYLSRTCQDYGERDHEAMMMAIKALEQEPPVDLDELKRKILMEVDGGTADYWLRYCDVCERISNSIDEYKDESEGK
jgi:hypothetical protein